MSTIERRWPRAVIITTALVAATVIAGTQFLHPVLPTADTTEVATRDAPPAGVHVLYVFGPQPHTIVAFDWTGHRRGSVTLASWILRQDLRMAPDGGAFVIGPGGIGLDAEYLDRLGRVVLETNNDSIASQIWSADSRHLCLFDGASVIVRLPAYAGQGGSDATRPLAPSVSLNGQDTLEACNLDSDAALLESLRFNGDQTASSTSLGRIRLSTGALLNSRDVGRATAVASLDAGFVAVTAGDAPATTTIYRSSDLFTPLGRLDPSLTPLAFSGDDTEVLALAGAGKAGAGAQSIEAVDWRTQRVAWRYSEPGIGFGPTLTRPSGHQFAVQLVAPGGEPQGVVIVQPDGTTTRLPAGNRIMVNN